MRRILTSLLLSLALVSSALAASTVNPNVPAQNSPLSSTVVRSNFAAANSDINNVLGMYAGTAAPVNPVNLQYWADTTTSPVYVIKIWNATTTTWVPTATINISTGAYSVVPTAGSFAAVAPLAVSFPSGVATYTLNKDANFTVNGSSQLALASIASGHLLANCTGGSAEPTNCAWSAYADVAIGSTNGNLPYRTGGTWGNISTGTSGATIPLNNTANVFSATQTASLNSLGALPTAITGTALRAMGANGSTGRISVEGYGAIGAATVARADGTATAPTQVLSTEEIGGFNSYAWGSNAAWNGPIATVRTYAGENITATAWGSKLCLATTPLTTAVVADSLCQNPSGGLTLGAPSGGDQGAGTLNLTSALYNNGTAPTGTGGYVRAISPTITSPTITGTGTIAAGTITSAAHAITSTSASALIVGAGGAAPAFNVDASTASSVTGWGIKSAAAGSGVTLFVGSSGTNESGSIDAKGSGSVNIGFVSTGGVSLGGSTRVTSASAACFNAGVNGATNPALLVDCSTASSATGVSVKSAAAGGNVALVAISSATNENILFNAKGTGAVFIGGVSSGGVNLGFGGGGIALNGTITSFSAVTIAGGASVTSQSLTTGSITADCTTRPTQFITGSTSAWSITAPVADSSCIILLTNAGASAIAPTFSGFLVGSNTGDPITTIASSKFMIWIARINGSSTYSVKALQ